MAELAIRSPGPARDEASETMLFVRGGNAGISHNPLETVTAHDAELAVQAFTHLLLHLE